MSILDSTIVNAYSQDGGNLPYFVGKQYGSGWLRTLGRFAFPILKKVMNVAGKTAQDAIVNEKPILESLRDNTINEAVNTLQNPQSLMSINTVKKRKSGKRQLPYPSFNHTKRRRRK